MTNRAQRRAVLAKAAKRGSWTWEERPIPDWAREKFPTCARIVAAFLNDIYSVQVYERATEWGEVTHLAIRRHDAFPVRSWPDLQRIKNEIAGAERIAVEVYPAAADVVDDANLYHLWVLPAGFSLPFGLEGRGGF